MEGGGDVSSWGPGQAWLPLWKSPTPTPCAAGQGADGPSTAETGHTFVLFTHFHVPHLVGLTDQGEGRRGQKWYFGARLDTGLDKPGLLLATPPHWPVKIKEARDLGRANPFTPRGTHLWETGGAAGEEGWTTCFRAGKESPCPG